MRLFVRDFDDVYGFVYMLAPKDNQVITKLIWLPDHMQCEQEVCHYCVSFEPAERTDEMRKRWLDGLPELLINLEGMHHGKVAWTPDQNVLKIEHENEWEAQILIEMLKSRESWTILEETGEVLIDMVAKVHPYVRTQAAK